jgi:tetratricopeptide (TPR) repeat protein
MRTFVFCLLTVLLALAQEHEKPVVLYPGLGSWHHPIHTASSEAQQYFDQGLRLMYGFNRYEALRSFRKAAELDPSAAMPYWGMAMAQGPYINMDGDAEFNMKTSCEAAAAGARLTAAGDREQAYLGAAARRCPEYQPQTYVEAMRALAARWPDDPDALTLYAESLMIPVRWHWYANDGAPAAGVSEAERVLEEAMRRWPDHPGANHLYIHVVESSHTAERAIPSAQRLMGIMPWAGHMVHMPGHIWLVVGDYEMAASVNERAVAVDREYVAQTGVTHSGYESYYVHNLHFVAYARWMQGRKADGLRASAEMLAALEPMEKTMPEMTDMFRAVTLFGHVRFADWDGILKTPQPLDSQPQSLATWRYARAIAFAARGERQAAEQERTALAALRAKLPAEAMFGYNKSGDVLGVALETITARLASTPAEAVPHWQRAVALQDTFSYDEPPDWYYPVRESLGAALLRAGRAPEAEAAFREGVKRSPRNGRLLFGLMESLRAQGKEEDAAWVKREFEAAWAKADVELKLAEM